VVRFSDMLGSNGDGEEAREPAATLDDQLPVGNELDPEPPPAANTGDSPEDVLARLTEYATSARAAERESAPDPAPAEPPAPPPAPAVAAPAPPREEPAGDDLLPRGRRVFRKPKRDS
jgi:hypothetical protein